MQLAFVLLGSVVVLFGIAVLARVRLELELSGRGEPNGNWVGACGIELGPVAFTGVAARGLAPKLEIHAIGRRFDVSRWIVARGAPLPREAPPEAPQAPAREKKLDDWLQIADSVLDARRRFALEALRLELGFGFRDIALTGRIVGALYALAGLLPRRVTLIQRPRWDGAETWELTAHGVLGIWPGLVLGELLWYMLRRAARRRLESAPRPTPAPLP